MVSTVASQQEGPGLKSRSCLCAVCMFSLCLRGFFPAATIKDMSVRFNTPVGAPDQGTGKDLKLVPRGCTVAAHCS